jgi:hypothetical protein
MPAEIELIDIYNQLYDPLYFEERDKLLCFEDILYKQVAERKEKNILGGQSCKEKKKDLIEAMKIALVKEWIPENKYILMGAWAYDYIRRGDDLCTNKEKIQILAKETPENIFGSVQKFIADISDFEITMRQQDLHIPKDFRTKRFTFYFVLKANGKAVEKPFMDVFNSLQYEIIPFHKNKLLIAGKWVLLRFLFIDLWILRLVRSMNLLSSDILNTKINYLWQIIEFFRKEYKFPDPEYCGIYKDYNIDKKINNLQGERFFPYYPHIYVGNKGEYRNI